MKTLFEDEAKAKRIRKIPKVPKNSKPYFPSNGTEGMMFEAGNCDICTKVKNCTILMGAYNSDKEPKQWCTVDNKDICISLKT